MRDETAALLAWYDRHARDLPWRVGPAHRRAGGRPDPYRVWLSEIMLQQTTVAAVRAYFLRFTELWPDVFSLAAADDGHVMGEWAGLGYYARARNLLACARMVVREHGGRFPGEEAELRALPGIGPYTAAAVAAIAFDQPATVVDGNVERVIARLRLVETPLPQAKRELTALAAKLTPQERPGDHAQAMMDLGATICTPRAPACGICPWRKSCRARAAGVAAELPRRSPRAAKPVRMGRAWVARRGELWLLERRPPRGLLGGTLGWPGTDWGEAPMGVPPVDADWQTVGEVRHTFTHFHLRLHVEAAELPGGAKPQRGTLLLLRPTELPTVMRKAFDLARSALDE
ncbi:A/G-specific adenine glycosylase [Roseitranquillus sediminis]|uniref:A/G-specific adenine glycosylase n=1 Tax=Roseitranquillus sediminis TaxID=2809051 RepID=UPI001D0CA3F4|nr:A/G-specific adenine glycosylase [Roseitranquillus sediminis]MBM9593462.1 A/G-specific adenine glycosylase [Roseitranquillus sediminis]